MSLLRKIPNPKHILLRALKQGWSLEGLCWAAAWGFTIGIFPIYGVTTGALAAVGWIGKLNHAVLQGFNYLVAPLKVLLILPYVALGETLLFAEERFALSLSEFTLRFQNDPFGTLQQFGMVFLHAVVGWLVTFPFLLVGVYSLHRFLFHLHQRVRYTSQESLS